MTQPLELITNRTLAKGYKLLKEKNLQMATSAEITAARASDEESELRDKLRRSWLYTANVGLYTVKDGKALFSLGESDAFEIVLGKNIDQACAQLLSNGNYKLSKDDQLWVVERQHSGKLPVFDIDSLRLSGNDKQYGYVAIPTEKKLKNSPQKTLAEIAYGKGDDLGKAMKMLAEVKIPETGIWVLKPDYVRQNLREGDMVARACWLLNFSYDSFFDAFGLNVNLNISVLGVSRASAVSREAPAGRDAKKR